MAYESITVVHNHFKQVNTSCLSVAEESIIALHNHFKQISALCLPFLVPFQPNFQGLIETFMGRFKPYFEI